MKRVFLLFIVMTVSACSGPILPWYVQEEAPAPVVLPEPVHAGSEEARCEPIGDGDGIGGTGCAID